MSGVIKKKCKFYFKTGFFLTALELATSQSLTLYNRIALLPRERRTSLDVKSVMLHNKALGIHKLRIKVLGCKNSLLWNPLITSPLLLKLSVHFISPLFWSPAFCVGKSSGLHGDPEDCRAYYDCSNNRTRHRTGLSTGLMFDPKSKQFLHSWEVNCPVKKGKAVRGMVVVES